MKALALALLLTQAPDAPKAVCLSPEETQAVAQRLVRLNAENESLRQSVQDAPVARYVVIGALVGAALGAVVAGSVVAAVKK